MSFDRLLTLLPCQSLEDFDLQRKDGDAEQLLAAWSALWHPTLLADAQRAPGWQSAESPPLDPEKSLIVVPNCCEELLPGGWIAQAEASGGCVLRNLQHRDEIVAAALQHIGGNLPAVDANLAADFLALGFCRFQVELLTRKLRYMSNLDDTALETSAVAAAVAAVAGDVDTAKQHLQAAFDRLHEAREYFYSNETRLIDLTLVASTTLGEPLRRELAAGRPCNLLISGAVLEEMAQCEPATLDALRQAMDAGTAAVIGGEYDEFPLPLLGNEAIAVQLSRGLAAYEKHLHARPVVFGRRRFGLTPRLPQILHRLGFTAAFHCTLDDGRFPTSEQSRSQWEGIDNTTLESLAAVPIDAARSEPFFAMPEKASNMNLDYTPTLVFAHWPGRSSIWYEDLHRIVAYSTVLGKFGTVASYFSETTCTGQAGHFSPDEYHSPYLQQDVSAGRHDPISHWTRYFYRRAKFEACEALETCSCLAAASTPCKATKCEAAELAPRVDATAVDNSLLADETANAALDQELESRLNRSLADFGKSLTGKSASERRGCLLVNPCSFPQQITRGASPAAKQSPGLPTSQSRSLPVSQSPSLPSLGFAWLDPNEAAAPAVQKKWFSLIKPKAEPPLGEENTLRNEFCEIHFDPHTGAIRSIHDYHSRDPRLAQQIALRLPHGGDSAAEANYSIMVADELRVTSPGPTFGEMVCHGRLLDREGQWLAGFRQTTRVWRGSPVIELLIELVDIERQPSVNPWDSYYAARFAWKDETSICRGVGLANVPTELKQIESPHFIDICRNKQHTTLLCGGLPYHRRFGHKLDTLLAVRGETARSFRLGIAIDPPHPVSAALGFLSPPLTLADQHAPPSPVGWLFHLDSRNVVTTHWEPTADGFRVRLLETDGRAVQLGLRCFRAVASARIVVGDGSRTDLTVEGDRVVVPMGSHEWTDVEVTLA